MAKHESPNSPPITIPSHLESDLSLSTLHDFIPFQTWLSTLRHSLAQQSSLQHPFHLSPYTLHSITIQSADFFRHNRLGFIKATADIRNTQNESLPASIFLRGGSAAMLILLHPDDAPHEEYAVLTVQARIPAGSLAMLELPAGMLDGDSFAGTAAKEIDEEIGIKVRAEELVNMSELALSRELSEERDKWEGENLMEATYMSPGGQDEAISFFLHRRSIPRAQMKEWQGKLTGLREDGEKITLKLVPVKDLWRVGVRDAKVLCAVALYENLQREGLLPT